MIKMQRDATKTACLEAAWMLACRAVLIVCYTLQFMRSIKVDNSELSICSINPLKFVLQ
jgi:hypothetical protein